MGTSATAAAWLLTFALPICLYVAWSDLARMRIPNPANLALVAVFAVIGAVVLPAEEYLWRWLHLAVVLGLGMAFNAAGMSGAGDAKFAAAAAPFVAATDLRLLLALLAGCLLAGYVTHRLAMHSPLRRAAAGWESWRSGPRFPMGFPLAAALGLYLFAAALQHQLV